MIGAMNDAVTVYDADVLTMSYGMGYIPRRSELQSKKLIGYSQQTILLSAEMMALLLIIIQVRSAVDNWFIAINTGSGSALTFNLVWYDVRAHNNYI